jgi:hypothetical protein
MVEEQAARLREIQIGLTQMAKQIDIMLGEDKVKPPKITKPKKVRYAEYVTMTEQEHAKLIEQFGVIGTEDRIDNLNLYKGSTGRKYASDYLTILAWERKNPAPKPKTLDKERKERMI